jgi:hypothetical protein
MLKSVFSLTTANKQRTTKKDIRCYIIEQQHELVCGIKARNLTTALYSFSTITNYNVTLP